MAIQVVSAGMKALGVVTEIIGLVDMGMGFFGGEEENPNAEVLEKLDAVREEVMGGIRALQLQGLEDALAFTDTALHDIPVDPSGLSEGERLDVIDDAETGLARTLRNARSIMESGVGETPASTLIEAVSFALAVRIQAAAVLEDGAFAMRSISGEIEPAVDLLQQIAPRIDVTAIPNLIPRSMPGPLDYLPVVLRGDTDGAVDLSAVAERLDLGPVYEDWWGPYVRLPIEEGTVTFDGTTYGLQTFGDADILLLGRIMTKAMTQEARAMIEKTVAEVRDLVAGEEIHDGDRGSVIEGTRYGDYIEGAGGADHIEGRGGSDVIHGEHGEDTIEGGDGADVLYGGDHDDQLFGGAGSDRFEGGAGDDLVVGGPGAGEDVAVFSGKAEDYTVTLTGFLKNTAVVEGADGTDHVVDVEFLAFDDITYETDDLRGEVNEIVATERSGTATGGSGDDYLRGGDEDAGPTWWERPSWQDPSPWTASGPVLDRDTLSGGAGNDTLDGESGVDLLFGGTGEDSFVLGTGMFGLPDVIADFEDGDTIVLDAAFFGPLSGGVEEENFVRGPAPREGDDFLFQDGDDLYFDADGSGGASATRIAILSDGARLEASDFAVLTEEGLLV